jgi:hypothetical protein
MASLVLTGDTSGQVTISAPAVAGTNTLTLPALTGTVLTTATSGVVLQMVRSQTSANTSGSTAIPGDNTIPQITEGFEVLTATITPVSATSKLYVQAFIYAMESTNVSDDLVLALFRDSTANALSVGTSLNGSGGREVGAPMIATAYVDASSTASTTFRARIGTTGVSTVILNVVPGSVTYPKYGGVYVSSMTITEIAQ